MKTHPTILLAWIFAATCSLGFFMPWARFAPESTGQNTLAIANTLLRGEEDFFSSYIWLRKSEARALFNHPGEGLSAYQILLLSDEDTLSSKVARAWLAMLWGENHAAMKVKVIILVPLLTFIGAVMLSTARPPQRWLLALASAQFGAYAFLRWKLNLSFTDRILWQIELSWGLWLGLFALLGAAVVTLARAFFPLRK